MTKERSLADQVYDRIKERIINETYPAGMALTEVSLAEEFEVSKTPVKSAISRLINEGWLESGFRKKVYVKDFTEQQIVEYYELRRLLEKAAVEKIFEADKNWEQSFKLEAVIVEMKASVNDYFALERADAKFHQTLINVFENEKIMNVYQNLNDELVRVNVLVYQYNIKTDLDYSDSIIDELEKCVLAIRDHDKASALHYLIDVHMKRGFDEAIEAIHRKEDHDPIR